MPMYGSWMMKTSVTSCCVFPARNVRTASLKRMRRNYLLIAASAYSISNKFIPTLSLPLSPYPLYTDRVKRSRYAYNLIPEINDEVVTEQEVEYGFCLHCFKPYSPKLKVVAVKLLSKKEIIWWHEVNCIPKNTPIRTRLTNQYPPCSLNLCDGSGEWRILFPGDNPKCFCKR